MNSAHKAVIRVRMRSRTLARDAVTQRWELLEQASPFVRARAFCRRGNGLSFTSVSLAHRGASSSGLLLTRPFSPPPPFRAKEIKTKLGLLLQKPEAAVDLVAPCSEKPAKTQK